ncbi:hypothetical protein Hanom_Chr01g00035211 [Helianthus anomalus]
MCENPTRVFNFHEDELVLGGVSSLLSYLRRVIVDGVEILLWALLQGDAKNFSFTHGNGDCEENPEVGSVPDSGTPLPEPPVHQVSEGSHNFPHVEDISNGEEEVEVHLPHKRKGEPVSVVGVKNWFQKAVTFVIAFGVPVIRKSNLLPGLFQKPPVIGKGSISKHLKVSRPSVSLALKTASVSCFL